MSGPATRVQARLSPVDSPIAYAAVACLRLREQHFTAYAALSCAVALPSLVWLVRSLVAVQGAEVGGAEIALRFEVAAIATTALAAMVGWLQVQLLLGRLGQRRFGELRLLALLAGSVRPVHRLMFAEAVVHATIGWLAGTVIALSLAGLIVFVDAAVFPAAGEIAIATGIGFVIAFTGVIAPTVALAIRLTRLEAGQSTAKDLAGA